uniref:3'(2'),5'-bisphosphate nucleotidase n=1 Tax=Aureoumbra lagunensis TaxID=44058 RepID=A0A7S3JVC1_9STRA
MRQVKQWRFAAVFVLLKRRRVLALMINDRSVWSEAWRRGMPYSESCMYYEEICVAVEAVSKACLAAKRVQEAALSAGEQVKSQAKGDASPVTIGDFAVQGIVLAALAAIWPYDNFVAEESAAELLQCNEATRALAADAAGFSCVQDLVNAVDLSNCSSENTRENLSRSQKRRWILDPIDGTRGFLRGAQFCCALALAIDGEPVLSVLGCPNLDLAKTQIPGALAIALKGHGAYVADESALSFSNHWRPLSARKKDIKTHFNLTLVEGVESSHTNSAWAQAVMNLSGAYSFDSVRLDSQAKAVMLADGRADCFMRLPTAGYREKVWDVAPAVILVQEAGGLFTDRYGRQLQFNEDILSSEVDGLLATGACPELHSKLVDALTQTQYLQRT